MFNIDTDKFLIEITRGDTASIVFGAKDAEGNDYEPTEGDELKLAVAKKVGADPIFEVTNTMDDDETAFWTINIPSSVTKEMKFADYAYDVQIISGSSVTTIIGKTDTITPTFRVWGEVASDSEEG